MLFCCHTPWNTLGETKNIGRSYRILRPPWHFFFNFWASKLPSRTQTCNLLASSSQSAGITDLAHLTQQDLGLWKGWRWNTSHRASLLPPGGHVGNGLHQQSPNWRHSSVDDPRNKRTADERIAGYESKPIIIIIIISVNMWVGDSSWQLSVRSYVCLTEKKFNWKCQPPWRSLGWTSWPQEKTVLKTIICCQQLTIWGQTKKIKERI